MLIIAQLPLDEWPPSPTETVAVLKQEPEDIETISRLRFEQTFDDLDYYKALIAISSTGRVFALRRYQRSPSPGLNLIVNFDTPEGMRAQVLDALSTLNLDPTSLTWLQEDLAPLE